ncbi:MAG TPA: hypothetical protein VEU51_03625, partial [Candidatus Acidoferrales bacterium]|nr:hypothetical protein [Candidatus Acidoferrales bacterium]
APDAFDAIHAAFAKRRDDARARFSQPRPDRRTHFSRADDGDGLRSTIRIAHHNTSDGPRCWNRRTLDIAI